MKTKTTLTAFILAASLNAHADVDLSLVSQATNAELASGLSSDSRLLFEGQIANPHADKYEMVSYQFNLHSPDGSVTELGQPVQAIMAPNEITLPYKTHIDLAQLNLSDSCHDYNLTLKATAFDFENPQFDYLNNKIGVVQSASIRFKVGDQSGCSIVGAPKNLLVVRGTNQPGNCVAQNVGNGNSPRVGVNELLTDLSVSCGDPAKVTIAQLKAPLPNAHACKSDLVKLRKKNKAVKLVKDPTGDNPYHCLLSDITPNEFVAGSQGAG